MKLDLLIYQQKVKFEYLDSLQTFATVGVLAVSSGDEVNYVNATLIVQKKKVLI